VDRVVGPTPAVDLVGDWHRAVGRDVEAEDQLFEVRPVVFIMAVRDPRFLDAPLVATLEGHRGRVVVDTAGVELELFDDVDRQVGKKTLSLGRCDKEEPEREECSGPKRPELGRGRGGLPASGRDKRRRSTGTTSWPENGEGWDGARRDGSAARPGRRGCELSVLRSLASYTLL